MRLLAFVLGVAVLAFWAWGRSGAVYAVPLEAAHRALSHADVPRFLFGAARVDVKILDEGPTRLVFRVDENGAEQLHFSVDMVAVDANSTRISVTVAGPETGPNLANAQRLAWSPTIVNLYQTAMNEQIASVLEGRAFDATRIYAATVVAVGANLGALSRQMDEGGKALRFRERANMEKAYEREAEGR